MAQVVEARRQALIAERRAMRQQMEAQNHVLRNEVEGGQLEWLRAIESIAPGNYDILTVTIYYPA